MKDNRDSKRILNGYLKNNPNKLIPIDDNVVIEELEFDVLTNLFS